MWHFIIALAFSVNPTNLQEIPWGAPDYPVFLVFAIWHKNCPLCKILIILWAYPVHSLSSMIDPVMVIIAVGLCSQISIKLLIPITTLNPVQWLRGHYIWLTRQILKAGWANQQMQYIFSTHNCSRFAGRSEAKQRSSDASRRCRQRERFAIYVSTFQPQRFEEQYFVTSKRGPPYRSSGTLQECHYHHLYYNFHFFH